MINKIYKMLEWESSFEKKKKEQSRTGQEAKNTNGEHMTRKGLKGVILENDFKHTNTQIHKHFYYIIV